ncbi:ATP-binding cassette domain-containing protein [Candidatus Dependentiae bacterium]|nr:ATP-binding cassette domain-containing protein [Candidatus Dependentiae bacterium]
MTLIGRLNLLLTKREKKIILLLLLASIFVSFLETFSISLIMLFAAVATNLDSIFKNKYASYVYNFFNFSSTSQFVIYFGFSLILFYFFRGFIISLFNYSMSRFSQGRFKRLSYKFLEYCLNFKYKNLTSNNSSKISTVIFGSSGQVSQIVLALLTISAESLTVGFIYLTLLWVNWKMTCVLTFLLSIKVLFIVKTFSGRLSIAGKKSHELNIKMARVFSESFWNFKLIKILSNEKLILNRFDNVTSKLMKANTLNVMLQNSPRIILETMGFSLLIAVIIYVLYWQNNIQNIIPIISMYAFAFYRFLPSINKILSEYNKIVFVKHALNHIQEYLTFELENQGNENINFQKVIKFQNLSFNYDEKNNILRNINLKIRKGERTAFVGESGAGKSTIVDIIMGFYQPISGSIFIDKTELTEKNLKSWRSKIGYIPQQIYLFDGTVAENVVFGRKYDEEKIIEVLKQANIYNFLQTQDGIHSKVGEGGVKFSGGQRQRIAIARALYSDPEILILDEATSALDHETESKIMDEIYNLNRDKTLIIVAHRLTTIQRCEAIYKIESGDIKIVDNVYIQQDKKRDRVIV